MELDKKWEKLSVDVSIPEDEDNHDTCVSFHQMKDNIIVIKGIIFSTA